METEAKSIHRTHIHNHSLSWLGIGTSIKKRKMTGQTSPPNEIMQSCNYLPHTSKIAIFIHLTSLTATQLHGIIFVSNRNYYKLSLRRRCMIHVERTMGNWNNINTRIPRETTRTTLVSALKYYSCYLDFLALQDKHNIRIFR